MNPEQELEHYRRLYTSETSSMVVYHVLENLMDYLLRDNKEYQETTNLQKKQKILQATATEAGKWLTDTLIKTAKD